MPAYVIEVEQRLAQLGEMAGLVNEGVAILESKQDLSQMRELRHEGWSSSDPPSATLPNDHLAEIAPPAGGRCHRR